MNICSPCSGDFAFSNHLLFLYNWFGGESESAFFFSLWSVHTVKLILLHNESRAVHSKCYLSCASEQDILATVGY